MRRGRFREARANDECNGEILTPPYTDPSCPIRKSTFSTVGIHRRVRDGAGAPRFYVFAFLWLGARSGEVFSFWDLPAVGESVEVPQKLKTRLLMLLEDLKIPQDPIRPRVMGR